MIKDTKYNVDILDTTIQKQNKKSKEKRETR